MTDTRRKIIELIEPYLDKTLNEDCYVFIDDELGKRYIKFHLKMEYNPWEYSFKSIVGHYDITAVLKYIGNHHWNFQQTYRDDFIWMVWRELEMSISDLAIPNKPLSLYTEEEDKALLELLQKIC